ncbi:hypothetical protein CNMCM7691_001677 [Aspergillus felis]|uniref:Protein-serine/threonine kinase n=1 Tax=Aspergillus felis TaxID=1287682 RepID=A0A8H6R029_9EURO|nr:hypothetical protein CNMCM7691_001677 [Aspergillus felis]
MTTSRRPPPAYTAAKDSAVYGTSQVYRNISESASSDSARILETSFTIRPCSGQAWVVPAGHICRLTTPNGPQVGDLNIWNANNPRERLWAARTRQIHASHVSVGDRLWSNLPYLRPLVTITGDSLNGGQLHEVLEVNGQRKEGVGFGSSQWGGRVHDLLGTRCDPYVNLLMGGETFDFHCHSNLTRAVMPYGLTELDVHDVLNVFQVTGLDDQGKYFMETSPAKPGEYFEFFAEVDVLCALSACPGGDLSQWGWEAKGEKMGATTRPLGVEVYKLADPKILDGWKQPESPKYRGLHGLQMPRRETDDSGYITLKPDAPSEELENAKKAAQEQGGTIKHEFTLIKAFTVEFPEEQVGILETNPHIHVEKDQEVKIQHGRPPLSKEALLASANFTLSLLPARLASRIQALRNLPFIVVSNPHISKIYNNYVHSLSTLLPYQQRQVTTLEEENTFADVLADLVHTHANTIPILARGFLECRKYINPADVTRFLDTHLRARIGTRLIAEQHLALHFASQPVSDISSRTQQSSENTVPSNYIGVIDTALQPARIVKVCEDFVGEICELKYGVRPRLKIGGQPDATFAHVPVHVEYIITELLKNAFRAVIESGNEREPIEVTIAAAPDVPIHQTHGVLGRMSNAPSIYPDADIGFEVDTVAGTADANESIKFSTPSSQSITIRIRDRGGGIPREVLPNIWSYSFTTFSDSNLLDSDNGNLDALNTMSASGGQLSSIAGLGYGLPLSRAYAEYFGGSIAIQSLWGWGTDVYLTLQGVGKIE